MPAMEDETVVCREASRYGLQTVKVMRAGGPVGRERWIREVLDSGADPARYVYLEWEEEELGMHYLQIWWRVPGVGRAYDGWE